MKKRLICILLVICIVVICSINIFHYYRYKHYGDLIGETYSIGRTKYGRPLYDNGTFFYIKIMINM